MKEIIYKVLYERVVMELNDIKEIVLATSYKDRVMARTINCVIQNTDIYFMTSKAYMKYKQIQKNPQVALSTGNIQIEGIIEDLGHPNENQFFKDLCEVNKVDEVYFKQYAHYKNTALLKVSPSLITVYEGNGAFYYLDLITQKAYQKGNPKI